MKSKIHPKYYNETVVTCVCGNSFTTGSTKKTIQVDICSSCHPFFTGEMKFVDTQGRVDKFRQKMQKADKSFVSKKKRKSAKKTQQDTTSVKTLKEMIQEQKKTVKKSPAKTKSSQ